MGSVNKVILVGNCGRDPEIRYLPSGVAIAYVAMCRGRRVRSSSQATAFDGHVDAWLSSIVDSTSQSALFTMFHEVSGGRDGEKRRPQHRFLACFPAASRSKSFFGCSKANKRNAP